MSSGRLLVANLDAEESWVAGGRRRSLPRPVRAGLSAFGTLLRVFADHGDRLWTPAPVDAARLADVAGLPQPRLVSGELAAAAAGAPILAWAETGEVAALRRLAAGTATAADEPGLTRAEGRVAEAASGRRNAAGTTGAVEAKGAGRDHAATRSGEIDAEHDGRGRTTTRGGDVVAGCDSQDAVGARLPSGGADLAGLALYRLPWHLPIPSPAAVARVADRAFCLRLAEELGCALPGARWIEDDRQLRRHLIAGGAAASPTGGWVLKAPFSAAGRHRLIVPHGEVDVAVERSCERLLSAHGRLLFEPWMERTADFGLCGAVWAGGVRWLGVHRQRIDARGGFQGVRLGDVGLAADERRRAGEVGRAVAAGLAARGYEGPFGIDFWRHRDAAGRQHLQPLGEVNPRLTFGFVAQALTERLWAGTLQRGADGEPGPAIELRMAMRHRAATAQGAAAGRRWLLRPGTGDNEPGAAWVDRPAPG